MADKIDSETEVTLEIENTPIKCNKQELSQHSDYFKAMFEGNFIERDKKVVKLEGITLNAMNIILSLLWDRENTILIEKQEDLMSVLQACCMLQFVEIKGICLDRLRYILCPTNCIEIWVFAEQLDLRSLDLKSKSMALMEFEIVKDLENVLQLDLKHLHNYLASTSLRCKTELDVFQVCMKWWYENSEKILKSKTPENSSLLSTEYFFNLLSCLDFSSTNDSQIQEIMIYPDISQNVEVMDILSCIINIRNGTQIDYKDSIINKANILSNSKPRSHNQRPCILLYGILDEPESKKLKMSGKSTLYYDAYKRKRFLLNVDILPPAVTIGFYDNGSDNFTTLVSIDSQKCEKLKGFQLVNYKEFIFLFGGEFQLGYSNWNKNLWVYDMIRESWERKSVIPFVRRHFKTCVCGDYLYIVGGTGKFRVIQDNIFWYSYKEDKWSSLIKLPCFERQTKCCCWNDQLLIININEKSGYLFDQHKSSWLKMSICDNDNIISSADFEVFSYKNSIYIKGEHLIEMVVKDEQLVMVKSKPMEIVEYMGIKSIICGDIVYTLYLQVLDLFTLEKYYIDSGVTEYVFKDTSQGTIVDIENNRYVLGPETTLFGCQYQQVARNDSYVNTLL